MAYLSRERNESKRILWLPRWIGTASAFTNSKHPGFDCSKSRICTVEVDRFTAIVLPNRLSLTNDFARCSRVTSHSRGLGITV
ncbi:hypothetical protein RHGRI_015517 [Rhododendron griersonianum]|uniref:Uncharacterized protein n=1 Tax=Rhododendron griersonianum TaxID=479676 RepID=A0AAV6KDJ2_9ERIC|nr:hypothetical protein RHGRI_015517 [Rhododendron griersonianum]